MCLGIIFAQIISQVNEGTEIEKLIIILMNNLPVYHLNIL